MAVLEVLTRDTLALNPGGARIMALVNFPPLSLIETGIKQQPHGPACYTFPLFFSPLFFFFFVIFVTLNLMCMWIRFRCSSSLHIQKTPPLSSPQSSVHATESTKVFQFHGAQEHSKNYAET